MIKHLKYLCYLLRHKWLVLVAGLRLGVPIKQLVLHDMSKFRRDEWIPYVHHFYSPVDNTSEFEAAWNKHCQRNAHHWEFWVWKLYHRRKALEIPREYLLEMVADWAAMGYGLTGDWGNIWDWWQKTNHTMQLHPNTRKAIWGLLAEHDFGAWNGK